MFPYPSGRCPFFGGELLVNDENMVTDCDPFGFYSDYDWYEGE